MNLKINSFNEQNIEIEEKIKMTNEKVLSFLSYLKLKNISLLNETEVITQKFVFKDKLLQERLSFLSIKLKKVTSGGKTLFKFIIKGKNKGNENLRIRPEKEIFFHNPDSIQFKLLEKMEILSEYKKTRKSFQYNLGNNESVILDLDFYNDKYSKDIILEIEGTLENIKKTKKIFEKLNII